MILLGLCGYARVGKDECCKVLGFTRAAFADALKSGIDPLFPDNTPKEIKRETYVAYGRAMRAIDPDHWIKRLYFPLVDQVAVTDVRYVNEVRHIQACGGTVIRISRPGYGPANYEEAQSFSAIEREYPEIRTVWNDGFPGDMAWRVRALLAGQPWAVRA